MLTKKMDVNKTKNWTDLLPQVTKDYNNSLHSTLKKTPYDVWTAATNLTPEGIPLTPIQSSISKIQSAFEIVQTKKKLVFAAEVQEKKWEKRFKIASFNVGDIVWVLGDEQTRRNLKSVINSKKKSEEEKKVAANDLNLINKKRKAEIIEKVNTRYKIKWIDAGFNEAVGTISAKSFETKYLTLVYKKVNKGDNEIEEEDGDEGNRGDDEEENNDEDNENNSFLGEGIRGDDEEENNNIINNEQDDKEDDGVEDEVIEEEENNDEDNENNSFLGEGIRGDDDE